MSQGNRCVSITAGQARACTVREALDRVGGKWSIGILVAASQGPVRFTELERQVEGISRRMLTLTLRNLERDGLLHREVYPTVPPKVEYTATPMALEALRVAGRADRLGGTAPGGDHRRPGRVRPGTRRPGRLS